MGNGLTLSLRMAIARVFPPYVSTLYWCAALPVNTQISVGFFFCFVLFCFVCLFVSFSFSFFFLTAIVKGVIALNVVCFKR